MVDQLFVSAALIEQMKTHILACFPEEGCGLVIGKDGKAAAVIAVENVAHSATQYSMEPRTLVETLEKMEESGMELIAIFHSHPHGPAHPSVTDIHENAYGDVFQIIWFRNGEEWFLRAYRLDGLTYQAAVFETNET